MSFSKFERATLAGLADVLIPAADGFPSASQAGVAGEWLDRVIEARPDLDEGLRQVLTAAEGRDPATTPLRDVMTKDVVMLPATSSLDHAIKIMSKNGIRHLPVEDQDHNIIGMISLRHLLHEKVDMVIEELNAVDAYHNDALGG